MPKQASMVTVRDPQASVWQSIVEKVAHEKKLQAGTAAAHAAAVGGSIAIDRLVDACHASIRQRAEEMQGNDAAIHEMTATGGVAAEVSGFDKAKRCSALAAQLAWAKVFGSPARVAALQSAFNFNVCDPFWADCVTEYAAYFNVHGKTIPYRAGKNNLLPWILTTKTRIAIFGDWGTGTSEAVNVLQQIKSHQPDVLLHLGDVFYSGTLDEMQSRHLGVVSKVFGGSPPRQMALAGNHDMYSGGAGYYWLVDRIEQGASYFAVQNNDWLLIGMDTGQHDFNPLTVSSNETFVEQSEADWINGLIAASHNQKVILFSHHPLFSAYEPIGGNSVNQLLHSQFAPSLAKVSAWFGDTSIVWEFTSRSKAFAAAAVWATAPCRCSPMRLSMRRSFPAFPSPWSEALQWPPELQMDSLNTASRFWN